MEEVADIMDEIDYALFRKSYENREKTIIIIEGDENNGINVSFEYE